MDVHIPPDMQQRLALPFGIESAIECSIVADPTWQHGSRWGEPRSGHPEGAVALHIADVLANVDRLFPDSTDRSRLRLIALTHDTFKYQVEPKLPKSGENHHGAIAARFLGRFTDDEAVLLVTRAHDDAYNAWAVGEQKSNWRRADERGRQLIQTLGPSLNLFLAFFACDNQTEGKAPDSFEWFVDVARRQAPSAP